MRRIVSLLAAGLLAVSLVTPALAAPVNNPGALRWQSTCPGYGTVEVVAHSGPGWTLSALPGTPPSILRAGTFHVWENGVPQEPIYVVPPPGLEKLEGRLVGPCTIELLGFDPAVLKVIGTDVWAQYP